MWPHVIYLLFPFILFWYLFQVIESLNLMLTQTHCIIQKMADQPNLCRLKILFISRELFVTVASSSSSTIGLKYLNMAHMLQISMNYCLIDFKMPGVSIHKFTIIEISIKTVKPNMNMGFKINSLWFNHSLWK